MNDTHSYPITNAAHIPSSTQDALRAISSISNNIASLNILSTDAFLDAWLAIHFLDEASHPDEIHSWPEHLAPLLHEAQRRYNVNEITEDQFYCSDSQHEGIRLEQSGNLNCYITGTRDANTGYISAQFDIEKGNQPMLTAIPAKAYIYESPKAADHACKHLHLDSISIYAGSPSEQLKCQSEFIPMRPLKDKEVVIQTEAGLYLYRDGKTLGDSLVRACKYRLYADNVEQQLQQIKTELNVTWTWVEYQPA